MLCAHLEIDGLFDYSAAHWLAFISASALLSLSPGPDMAYMLAQTAKNGQRGGLIAMFGVWTGALIHALFAAAGLSAILAASATAFTTVKWAGALYLVSLGIQAIRSAGATLTNNPAVVRARPGRIYWQGVIVATLNPKDAIFYLAFLPQFVVPGAGPVSAQLLLHGCLIIVVAAFIEPPLVMLGARLTRYLQLHQGVARCFDRCLGGLFIALGVRLALTERV